MNEVVNEMFKRRDNPYPESILMKFINTCNNYDTIIIVEGISDEDFYKNTNIDILNNKRVYYIFASRRSDNIDNKRYVVGKEAVITSYFEIRDKYRSNPFKNSVIFIVDKDFFGIDWDASKYRKFKDKMGAKSEDINNFTILDCHSHECYFILEKNIDLIFKLLGIGDKIEQFNNILNKNLDELCDYFAYKSILLDENPKRTNRWDYDFIENTPIIRFNFKFDGEQLLFNRDDMKNDIEKMKKEVEFSKNRKNLEIQYNEMKQKFKNKPELLRGHTLFELLESFLNYYGKKIKDYKEYNNEIINKMSIPLDIKILNFSSGGYKVKEKNDL